MRRAGWLGGYGVGVAVAFASGSCTGHALPVPQPDPFETGAAPSWDGSGPWMQFAEPAEAGWSAEGLEEARRFAESIGSAAVMAVYRGRVVAAWGAVERRMPAYSVRKTLLGGLYGIHVQEGDIDLDSTLGELGVQEIVPLTEQEKTARVRDLLGSRSGVYLPAAYAPTEQDEYRPERDAYPPGRAFFYNNWDFNALGSILMDATGVDLFEDFQRRIAEPLGMEDFRIQDGAYVLEPHRSLHPAYTFRVSARDLARFGLLYLRRGVWGDERILAERWIEESWTSDRIFENGGGYGFLWHIGSDRAVEASHPASVLNHFERYLAVGTGGQIMMVIPALDLVLVHRGDTENDRLALDPEGSRTIRDIDVIEVFARIVSAKVGSAAPDARLVEMTPAPLAGVRPQPPVPTRVELGSAEIQELVGEYQFDGGRTATVFEYAGRLFVSDTALGETELFLSEDGWFFVTDAPYLRIEFTRDRRGRIETLVARERAVVLTGRRVAG